MPNTLAVLLTVVRAVVVAVALGLACSAAAKMPPGGLAELVYAWAMLEGAKAWRSDK